MHNQQKRLPSGLLRSKNFAMIFSARYWNQQRRKDVRVPVSVSVCRVPEAMLVSRIALVSQERYQQIQTVLLRMAQGGQLRSKVTEAQLIDLLDQVCRPLAHGSILRADESFSSKACRILIVHPNPKLLRVSFSHLTNLDLTHLSVPEKKGFRR